MGRNRLAIAGAALAAAVFVLVLDVGPGPRPESRPSQATSATQVALASATPTGRLEPTAQPTRTPIPTPRGQYVGPFFTVEGCLHLHTATGDYEMHLPRRYGYRFVGNEMDANRPLLILDRDGNVLADQRTDLIGVNGRVEGGGSFCMASYEHLYVSEIVDVVTVVGQ